MKLKELAENIGLEEDEFMELAELFVETTVSDLDKLEAAIAAGGAQEAAEAAHSIKGAAGNLGFQEIFELAKTVELNARNQSLAGSPEAIRSIKEKLDDIQSITQ